MKIYDIINRMKNRVIYFDLETTGLDSTTDKIIEIAAIDNNGNEYDRLINPNCIVSDKIIQLTGINNKMLKYRSNMNQLHSNINTWFDFGNKNVYLVAHNGIRFDMKFLMNHFYINCKIIDTIDLYKKLLPDYKYYSLKSLCEYFGMEYKNAHRAMNDVVMLRDIFEQAVIMYKSIYKKKEELNSNLDDELVEELYKYVYG